MPIAKLPPGTDPRSIESEAMGLANPLGYVNLLGAQSHFGRLIEGLLRRSPSFTKIFRKLEAADYPVNIRDVPAGPRDLGSTTHYMDDAVAGTPLWHQGVLDTIERYRAAALPELRQRAALYERELSKTPLFNPKGTRPRIDVTIDPSVLSQGDEVGQRVLGHEAAGHAGETFYSPEGVLKIARRVGEDMSPLDRLALAQQYPAYQQLSENWARGIVDTIFGNAPTYPGGTLVRPR